MIKRRLPRCIVILVSLIQLANGVSVFSSGLTIERKSSSNPCTPQFQVRQRVKTERLPVAVAVGDFNGDKKNDLVVANSGSNTVSIYVNDQRGDFSLTRTYNVGPNPRAVAVADLNSDHH